MKKNPMISVIVTAHNEEEDIEEALDSILAQTYKNYEIIVVNDGSTDRTEEIVRGYMKKQKKIRIINFKEGHSAAFARNAGLKEVKGDIVIFFDADCVAVKNFLEMIAANFQKFDVQAVAWKTQAHKPKTLVRKAFNARRKSLPFHRLKKSYIFGKECPALFCCLDTKVAKRIGGYNKNIFYFEDADLAKRFFADGNKVYFDYNLNLYHKDPDDMKSFIRQSRWIARGTKRLFKSEPGKSLKLFTTHLVKTAILFSPLLLIFNWTLGVLGLASLLTTIGIMTAYMAKNSRDIWHSFVFSIISMIRSPIVSLYFLVEG